MAATVTTGYASSEVEHTGEPSTPAPVVKLRRFPGVPECTMPVVDAPCTRTECRHHLAHRSRVGEHRLKPTRDCALEVAN